MRLVFFSNTLNHHQIALCDQFYHHIGDNFSFVENSPLNEERKKMGFQSYERPYKINGRNNREVALKLVKECDVAIMGAESYEYLKMRIKKTNKLTFSFSERWLKKGIKNILSPPLLKQAWLYYKMGYKKPWYMLCASGFLQQDLYKFCLFKDRCFEWGYFPDYKFVTPPKMDREKTIKILWVGRFLDWKHPEMMVYLAQNLVQERINFRITMIGDGEEKKNIQELINQNQQLKSKLILKGNMPNEDVIKEMQQHNIFCFTSDRQEGWGAVLGEAMASGCCPVASSDAGATPFLVENNVNGLIFNTNNSQDLIANIRYLYTNPNKIYELANNASNTISAHWTAETAALNFITLAKALLKENILPNFQKEPCSLIKI